MYFDLIKSLDQNNFSNFFEIFVVVVLMYLYQHISLISTFSYINIYFRPELVHCVMILIQLYLVSFISTCLFQNSLLFEHVQSEITWTCWLPSFIRHSFESSLYSRIIFQQDGANPHYSTEARGLLNKKINRKTRFNRMGSTFAGLNASWFLFVG